MYFLHHTLLPIVGPTLLIIGALLAGVVPIVTGTLGLLDQINFDRHQKKIVLAMALGALVALIGLAITWYAQ